MSLDLHTPIQELEDYLAELEIVQLMAIEAGFQGQEFQDIVLKKIQMTKSKIKKHIELIVDGGVKLEHLEQLKQVGVDGVTVGSGIWQAPDPTQAAIDFLDAM